MSFILKPSGPNVSGTKCQWQSGENLQRTVSQRVRSEEIHNCC
jgi:hypothetical protein